MTTIYDFLPHHLLSSLAGKLARCKQKGLKNTLIRSFCQHYGVDLTESMIEDPTAFASFNDFFTRQLKAGVRPIGGDELTVVSPADGQLVAKGVVRERSLLQAKGRYYTLPQLLGDEVWADKFLNASYFTVYLSPRDYHRVHMPLAGNLLSMRYVPGRLFPVNEKSTRQVDRLFARNERVISYFQTPQGPMAVILVGALLVGQMSTVWQPEINSKHPNSIRDWHYDGQMHMDRGAEMGHFSMGSTAIVLLPTSNLNWGDEIGENSTSVKMGQSLAEMMMSDAAECESA